MSKVNTTHPQYDKMTAKWKRCRDAYSGQDAIHEGGETYLPRLDDQETEAYKKYKGRAFWFGATGRTIAALSGMLFRKAPVITVAESVKPLLEDVTMGGVSLYTLAYQTAIEILDVGRMGVLVDYPQVQVEGLTKAEAEKLNLRPSMQKYQAESIINWKTAWIGNATVLTMVVLKEEASLESDNEFEHKTEERYRVLDLAPYPGKEGLYYRVRVYRISSSGEDEQIGPDIFPLMNNKPLPYIPFYFFGIDDTAPTVDEPPLLDLVNANIAHYKLDADRKHGLHFAGLPTPILAGYQKQDENEKLYIGSGSAWVLPDPNAKWGFLEFMGQGLGGIKEAQDELREIMAVLGARLLMSEKKDAETSQTAEIHRAGESSTLSAIAETIGMGFTQALKTFSKWAGVESKDVKVEVNKEFLPPNVTPQEIEAWLKAYQAGAPGFSDQEFFARLKRREYVSPDATLEDEQARIASKQPSITEE